MFLKMGVKLLFINQKELFRACEIVKRKEKCSKFRILLDIIRCSFVYGCIYTEYVALDFFHRTKENRKTYITTLYWLTLLNKYNPEKYRKCFHDKREFNKLFYKYIGRNYLDISSSTEEEIREFLYEKKKVVLKISNGCSGKQICVLDLYNKSIEEVINFIKENKYNLIEEYIENIDILAKLNPTSLNTIRIVTIHSDACFEVICAMLRIGAKGEQVDNISQGGSSAQINVKTGKLSSDFFSNAYREVPTTQKGKIEISGGGVPYWEEALQIVQEASKIVPEIHIVGWDVAITEKGPVLIEGNESCDSAFMQFYNDCNTPGIKEKVISALALL